MSDTTNIIRKASKSVIYMGLLALLLGILALIYPTGIGKFSAIVIGVFFIVAGSFRMFFAIASFSIGSMILRYLYAILMIIAGIWIILNPEMSLEFLTLLMAVYFIIDGITEISYSISLTPVGGGLYLLLSGVIGIVLGGLIFIKWPESSNYALGIYLGIKLVVDGLMLFITGITIKKTAQIL